MARLGLLFAGLSGAGKGLAAGAEQDQKVADEQRLMAERSRLDEEKANRIAEAQATRTRQAGIQQGQDIGAATTNLQNQRDADAINAANSSVEGGSNMTAADAQVLRNQPAARQAYGLLNPTRQSDLEDRATAAEKLGYLDAAKETRSQLQTEVTNNRNEANDVTANKRLDQQLQMQKDQMQFQNKVESRRASMDAAQIEFMKSRANKEDSRAEQMAASELRKTRVEAMKGAETDMKALDHRISTDLMMSPEEKKIVQEQRDTAAGQARQIRALLLSDGSPSPSKPFNPNDFKLGGSDSKSSSNTQPSSSGANVRTVTNPIQMDTPSPAVSKQLAVTALEKSLNQTSRDLAAANASGNKAEIARLSDQFKELSQARSRAQQ